MGLLVEKYRAAPLSQKEQQTNKGCGGKSKGLTQVEAAKAALHKIHNIFTIAVLAVLRNKTIFTIIYRTKRKTSRT